MRSTFTRSIATAALALVAGIGLALAPAASADPQAELESFDWISSAGGTTVLDVVADADTAGKFCVIRINGVPQANGYLQMGANIFAVPWNAGGYEANGPAFVAAYVGEQHPDEGSW